MKTYDEHCKEIGMSIIDYDRRKRELKEIAKNIYKDYEKTYGNGDWYDIQELKIEERTKDVYEYKEVMTQLSNIGIKLERFKDEFYFHYNKRLVN